VYLLSKALPAVSSISAGLVSAKPRASTTWTFLGLPSTGLVLKSLRRTKTRPMEYDISEAIVGLIGAPLILPAEMLRIIAEAVEEQARYESDLEARIRMRLSEIRMRYEMDEISKEEYKGQEAELQRRLKEVIEEARGE